MTSPRSAGSPNRRRVLLGVLVAAVVAVLAVVAVVVVRGDGDPAGGPTAGGTGTVTPTAPSTSTPPASTEVRYVAPTASGSGDGSSWDDAGTFEDLPDLVAGMSGGGQVWLRADAGPYVLTDDVRISSGGVEGNPVVVRGVDAQGQPAPAVLQGDRTSPYDPDGNTGGDVFSLRAGASHLVFSQLAFENVGNAFLAAGDVTDLQITDTTGTNIRRFFENAKSDSEPSADVSGLVIRKVTVTGFSKRVVRLRYGSNNVLLEDVVGDSQAQDGDDFAIGVHLEDEVNGVVLRRVTMNNTRDTLRDYWNGDGFATERGVYDITFEDTAANGNTDAGYDLKSTRTTLVNATASDNKRNFRFWADDTTVSGCVGTDPQKRGGNSSQAQLWLGEGAAAELQDCTFTDSDPETTVFVLEPDATLTMTGGTIEYAGELEALQGGAEVDLQDVNR